MPLNDINKIDLFRFFVYPQRITKITQQAEIGSAIHNVKSVNAIQAIWIYALPNKPKKNRVPRVVGIFKKPRRSTVGDISSHTSIPPIIEKMAINIMAVGNVQYIHSRLIVIPLYTRPRAKPLAK
jgi:hypothetical protein